MTMTNTLIHKLILLYFLHICQFFCIFILGKIFLFLISFSFFKKNKQMKGMEEYNTTHFASSHKKRQPIQPKRGNLVSKS